MYWLKINVGFVLVILLCIACDNDPKDTVAASGILKMPLVASGVGGVTYRLSPGTYLAYGNNNTEDEMVMLDGPEDMLSLALLADDYTATMNHLSESYPPNAWELVRRSSTGEETTVMAELLTPFPQRFTIVKDTITSLIIRFRINDNEIVVFSIGQLNVSVEVEQSDEPVNNAVISGDNISVFSVGPEIVVDDPPGFASFHSAMREINQDEMSYYASIDLTTDWELTTDGSTLCALADIVFTEQTPTGSLWGAFLTELGVATDIPFCIESIDSMTPTFFFEFQNLSAATTPEVQGYLGVTEEYTYNMWASYVIEMGALPPGTDLLEAMQDQMHLPISRHLTNIVMRSASNSSQSLVALCSWRGSVQFY